MDELIKKVMNDIGIDQKFINNPAIYNIIQHYIRIKLRDLYSYDLYINAKEDIECTQEEIHDGIKNENSRLDTSDMVNSFDVRMLKYFNSKMNNQNEWKEVTDKIKHNMKILEKIVRIISDENKMFISYKAPWEIENVVIFYNEFNGSMDVKKTVEEPIMEEENNEKKQNSVFYVINEKYDPEGERLEVDFKDFGNRLDKEKIKKQVNKLRRKYYDDVFQKLDSIKNKGGAKLKNVIDIIQARLRIEQQEENDIFNKPKQER